MTALVASGFSLPRKLILLVFMPSILVWTFILFRDVEFDIELPKLRSTGENARNATELGLDTDAYLDELIHRHDLSTRVEWAAWNIRSTQTQAEWNSVTRVSKRFQPRRPQVFDVKSENPSPPQDLQTLRLPSPRGLLPGQFDASGYLFGVSTTYDRLMENDRAMLKSWHWWLTDGRQDGNGAHIVIMLDRANDQQIWQLQSVLDAMSISAMVYNAEEPLSTATRYSQLAGELHAFGSALSAVGISKRWFTLLDDTIFFPSLSYLDEKLRTYNAAENIYIGVPSGPEDWVAHDGKFSTTGGGVVIMSRSGLAKYLSLSCAEIDAQSESSFHSRRWTSIIHECMTSRGEIPMQVILGLYSPTVDVTPSVSADLENGARPIALRGRVRGINLPMAYLVADECGEACFMQRFLFRDNWVLVNGVSISQYQNQVQVWRRPHIIPAPAEQSDTEAKRDAKKSQLQLNDAGGDRIHITGGGARNLWKLLDASVDDRGIVWQAYVKRAEKSKGDEADEEAELDSVIILIWNEGKEEQ